jgi:hypothetical protein
MPDITGGADVAFQFGLGALNRGMASAHARGLLMHQLDVHVADSGYKGATGVRGRLRAQFAPPEVLTDAARPGEIELVYRVMARFDNDRPDPGGLTPVDPAPHFPEVVHGDLSVRAAIDHLAWQDGALVTLDFGADRLAGLSFRSLIARTPAADTRLIETLARNFAAHTLGRVHEAFALPAGLSLHGLRTLAGGPRSGGVALLLGLTPGSPRPSGRGPETVLRNPDEIAVGVDARVVRDQLSAAIVDGAGSPEVGRFRWLIFDVDYSYALDPARIDVRLEEGRIVVSAVAHVTAGPVSADVRVTLPVMISLDREGHAVVVFGRPDIEASGLAGCAADLLRGELTARIGQLVPFAQAQLNTMIGQVSGASLVTAMAPLGVDASIELNALEVHREGLLFRGRARYPSLGSVIATFATAPGGERDAFASWIPGGRVERYEWTRATDAFMEVHAEEHRFFLPGDLAGGKMEHWCLNVSGTWADATGARHRVQRATCVIQVPRIDPDQREKIPYVVFGGKGPSGPYEIGVIDARALAGDGKLFGHLLGAAPAVGDLPPEFHVELAPGGLASVRTLIGRPVELLFTADVAPVSMHELERLGQQKERIVVVHEGQQPPHAKGARLAGLTMDVDGAIRRRFGIAAWPTLVSLDARGRVTAVRVGAQAAKGAQGAKAPPKPKQ